MFMSFRFDLHLRLYPEKYTRSITYTYCINRNIFLFSNAMKRYNMHGHDMNNKWNVTWLCGLLYIPRLYYWIINNALCMMFKVGRVNEKCRMGQIFIKKR